MGEEVGLGKSVGHFKISDREPLRINMLKIYKRGSFKIGLEGSARIGKN